VSRQDHRSVGFDDHQTRVSGFVYIIMLVVVVAFGALVWDLYSGGREAPHIAAPGGAYKIAPPPEAAGTPDSGELSAFAETGPAPDSASLRGPILGPASAEAAEAPVATGQPRFVADGPFVAQVAALQSEAAVDAAWRRLSSRAPDLFAPARLDVERADLGQRGVYYRVRAGYFASRADANLFCDRIERLGQDCIAVAR